jgi:S1-C subfamily serine protease
LIAVSRVDWITLGVVAVAALAGLRHGFLATVLSLGGLVGGALIGARVAPHFLHGGSTSPYTPVAALIGAGIGAVLLQSVGSMLGSMARGGLAVLPPLRAVDSVGGIAAGAAWGLAVVWVAAVVALQFPGQTQLRREVQQSEIVRRLNEIAPPQRVLRALARIDPFPSIAGPPPPSLGPDPRVLAQPGVRRATPSVLRVTATACGLGVEGSGWVARPQLVVTAAHVIAGGDGIRVGGRPAEAWVVDRGNDVAILRVPGLRASALRLAPPQPGKPVAILGYPENGPFDARAGRIGDTAAVIVDRRLRTVTALSGVVRHGNSGGPAVDPTGAVRATVFASRIGSGGGYGIPAATVERALARATRPVSTGAC